MSADNPIKVTRVTTLEEIVSLWLEVPQSELAELEMHGFDQHGQKWRFSFAEFFEQINKMGAWGFHAVNEKQHEIYLWFKQGCNPVEIIKVLGHEYGHAMLPHYKYQKKEEMKAGCYERGAAFAFSVAQDLGVI